MIRLLLFALLFAMPAAADDVFMNNTTSESNMCVIDVTGQTASTPSAVAHANWSPITYNCAAGTYLPAGNNWPTDTHYSNNNCARCPIGYYCPGGSYQYSETSASGLMSCDSTYTMSMPGASAQTDCYRYCTTSDVAHSTAVIGRVYYGTTPVAQCAPTTNESCSTGYSYTVITAAPMLPSSAINGSSISGHSLDDTRFRPANLAPGEWYVTWNDIGIMRGISSCNTTRGDYAETVSANAMISETTGEKCWCLLTTWTPNGNSTIPLSAKWVFRVDYGGTNAPCARDCANDCAIQIRRDVTIREAIINSIGDISASCNANTITVNWDGYGTNNNETQSTTCTYGGDLTTPSTAPTKRGHIFTGWSFNLN